MVVVSVVVLEEEEEYEVSCRWSRTAAGIGSGTATAVARRRRAKERAVERRCIVLNDVLLGLLLVISDDDGDGGINLLWMLVQLLIL